MDAKEYLKIMSNELHKPVTRHFPRTQVITRGIDDVWAADLADMNEFKDNNDGVRFILTIIDCFSRYAWAVPIPDKTGDTVLNAFKKVILVSGRKPARLWVDQGKEFINKKMQKWLADNSITSYHTFGEHKAATVERFNRTLKSIMWRKLTEEQSNRWIDTLPELLQTYNTKKHSTIKMTPEQASMKKNEDALWKKLYGGISENVEEKAPHFEVGDWVRISRIKAKFEKGYTTNWTQEIFKIYEKIYTDPITHKLQDYLGEQIKGSFYGQEIQKTALGDVFIIEKILDTRKINGKLEYLVKFLGYESPKFNEWISDSNFVKSKKTEQLDLSSRQRKTSDFWQNILKNLNLNSTSS